MELTLFKKYNKNGFLLQFLAVIVATLNAISDGMNIAWSSPMIPRLLQDNSPIKIDKDDETWLEMMLLLSGFIGLPLTTVLVDKIGRKQSTLVACIVCITAWVLIGLPNNLICLYIGRFLMGLSSDIGFISSPIYVAEISHKSYRGFLSGTINVMSLSGILLMYIIGPKVDFYVPSLVGGAFLIIQLIILPFMPDSPHFLITKGKIDKAKTALIRLRNTTNIDDEFNEILRNIEQQKMEKKGKFLDIFCLPNILKATIIMAVLNMAFHMVGFTVITMNLHYILDKADSTYLDDETSAILFAALMVIAASSSILFVDKFGRRKMLMVSSLLTGTTLLVTTIYFYLQIDNDVSNISWLPVVSIMIFAITFKIGLGIVPIVLTSELFPTNVKAYGMAFADGIYITFGSVSIYVYEYLKNNGGMYTPFLIFTICGFIVGIFTFFFIPETKGRTLGEVQDLLKK